MSGHLCLKWNNHSSAFLKSITSIHAKEKYCDATIVCQGKYFPVHRVVLSTCSEYFDEMFERMQCQHPYIVFKDIDPKEMELLLNYMYQGEVNVIQENLPMLIKAAEALRIKGLAVPDDLPSKESSGKKRSSSSNESSLSKRRAEERRKRRDSSQDFPPESESYSHLSSDKNSLFNESSDTTELKNIKEEPLDTCEYVVDNSIANASHSTSLQNESQKEENMGLFVEFPVANIKTEEGIPQPETSGLYEEQSSSWSDFSNTNMEDIPPPPDMGDQEDMFEPNQSMTSYPIQPSAAHHFAFTSQIENQTSQMENQPRPNTLDASKPRLRFSCPSCSYESNFKMNVRRHIMFKHTGEKPFQCAVCSRKFTLKEHLQSHMRMHTGEKPYSCIKCFKRFKHQQSLKYHYLTHNH